MPVTRRFFIDQETGRAAMRTASGGIVPEAVLSEIVHIAFFNAGGAQIEEILARWGRKYGLRRNDVLFLLNHGPQWYENSRNRVS